MVFTTTEIEKIANYKTWSSKKKLDALLKMDCNMYCHLGSDSTKKEREEVRKTSRKIYTAIKSINEPMGSLFLTTMDIKREQ